MCSERGDREDDTDAVAASLSLLSHRALSPCWPQDPEGRIVHRTSRPGSELYTDGDGRRVRRYEEVGGGLMEDVLLRDGTVVTRTAQTTGRMYIPQNLSDLAWAFSDRNHKDERLFNLIAER